MPTPPFVVTLDMNQAQPLRQGLEEQGFELSQPAHTLFSGRKPGITCTLYKSGKLVVQGKKMAEFIEFYLEPHVLGTVSYSHAHLDLDRAPRMGGDEAGKGDFFGPLCIAALFAEGDGVEELWKLGCRDSKSLSDRKVIEMARTLRQHFPHHVLRLMPVKYNELYSRFKNLNRLLAWAHAATLDTLHQKTGCTFAIVDQFANERVLEGMVQQRGLGVKVAQRTRAESDPVVAAASILARAAFLEGLEELSRASGIQLPKGAGSPVIRVAHEIKRRQDGERIFPSVAKLHFKTYTDLH